MTHLRLFLVVLLIVLSSVGQATQVTLWGFYAHRLINEMALYHLPNELMVFYKNHVDYIQAQATAPDKRRYASPIEAVRHYIDLDTWQTLSREDLAQPLHLVIADLAHYSWHHESGDIVADTTMLDSIYSDTIAQGIYHNLNELIENHTIELRLSPTHRLILRDSFTQHGIVPYHILHMQKRLEKAFRNQNTPHILRISAELGHYLSDMHVPLHTTSNYNGQLSNQEGIHAFWESRIPEVLAESSYDFFTGSCDYIEDMSTFVWQIVYDTHSLVPRVLHGEKTITKEVPMSQQYCWENRNGYNVKLPCREFAMRYEAEMDGMVEKQMIKSISAIASIWYTSWVNAGMPPLDMATSEDSAPDNNQHQADNTSTHINRSAARQ